MNLDDFNAVVTEAGYQPISGDRFQLLSGVCGRDLRLWAISAAREGQLSASWEELRSALYSVSAHCEDALHSNGITVPADQRVRVMLAGGRNLRLAVMKLGRGTLQGAAHADLAQKIADRFGVRLARHHSVKLGSVAIDQAKLHKVFGLSIGFTFEWTTARSGRNCLQVEAARRNDSGRGFDWARKLVVQLVDHEVVEFLAVVRGGRAEAVFSNHGPGRDKTLTIRQQDVGTFYLNLRQGRDSRGAPMEQFHAYQVQMLAVRAMMANDPMLTAADVFVLVDDVARRFPNAVRAA